MIRTMFQDGAAGVALRHSPLVLLDRSSSRHKVLRRRRKIPSWVGVALLVVVADIALAVLAWLAVDVVLH